MNRDTIEATLKEVSGREFNVTGWSYVGTVYGRARYVEIR